MVTSYKNAAEVAAFQERLNELLDARQFESKGKGRQVALAKKLDISQNGARKWLEGEGLPEFSRVMQLAKLFDCSVEWLATGRGARDLHVSQDVPMQRLIDRLTTADEATKQLVELALLESDKAASARLSPSLLAMVRGLKDAIAVQDGH